MSLKKEVDMKEHLRTTEIPSGNGTRELTNEEIQFVSGGTLDPPPGKSGDVDPIIRAINLPEEVALRAVVSGGRATYHFMRDNALPWIGGWIAIKAFESL